VQAAKANFSDKDFEEVGAKIVDTAKEIYSQSDIVLKVKEPTVEEVDLMREGLVMLSYLWPAQNQDLLQKLADKKVNAVAMDAIPRISQSAKNGCACRVWQTLQDIELLLKVHIISDVF
jgi:NAD(P) transhydrogenase subunit alpha